MQPRSLHLIVSLLLGLVIIATGSVWINGTAASIPTADFAAPYSPREAAAVVAAAQGEQAEFRAAYNDVTQSAALPYAPTVYFAQTGHHVSDRTGFLTFWREHGQTLIFGYPISEEVVEGGQIVQYFERARFEYSAENGGTTMQVQLGLLGRELSSAAAAEPFAAVPDPQNGYRYFPETEHTLWGEFRDYWEGRGGLAVFGYPISEEFDQDGRIVQYFERARFEYHAEDMAPFYRNNGQALGIDLDTLHETRLTDLGREVAANQGIDTAPVAQIDGTAQWTPALWERHISIDLSTQLLTAYEDDLAVYSAPVATGRDGFNTPTGEFAVYYRLPMQTMSGAVAGESWNVPDVPWVMYVVGGVALHGTYWHDAFGTGARLSHGCVNLSMDDAQWLYEWADLGTTVSIHY